MPSLPFRTPCLNALVQGYDDWATNYDRDVHDLGYATVQHVAEAFGRHFERRTARVLDVGAGTGLLGGELHRRGYRHLTGIDASHGMLVQAARKGIYHQLSRMVLGRPLAFADQTFDGLAAAGVFSTGPVPPESLLELDRILRPGGGIVFSLPWDGNSETMFLEILQKLEARGRWRREEASDPYASWPRHDPALQARVLAYRVL